MKDIFDEMVDRWPSAIVARTQVEAFSGGMMSGKYLANFDSQKIGPQRVIIGRRVGYPATRLAEWLRERSRGG